jgi:tocopherol O-methyltransferase
MVTLNSPQKETIKKFYDIGSPYYREFFGEHIHDGYYITGHETRAEAQENLIKLFVEKAEIPRGAKILDVGCGMGGSSIWLSKNLGAKTVGITLSPKQVEIASASAAKNHTDSVFSVMDAEKLEFNETFDVIWAVAVTTHLENQKEFINRATRLLDTGGTFIIFDWMLTPDSINTPNDKYIKSVRRGMLLQSMYTLLEYQTWFTENGYDITYMENITQPTIHTWDDALSVVRQPAIWKMIVKLAVKEGKEALDFARSLNAMKTAMKKGTIIAGVIIARKK